MGKKVRVVLNRNGVRQLLRSDEMKAVCRHYADAAASRLGTGYEVSDWTGKNRVNAEIAAVSRSAKEENNSSNSILKALRG